MIAARPIRPRKCKHCREVYTPALPMQRVCGLACAQALAQAANARKAAADRRAERKADRAKREKLKPRREWLKEAQAAFNAFIRARDADKPCICCGRLSGTASRGGEWDAGHYRSVGSAPHLRFDERNCHRQLKQCNRFGSGRAVDYRLGLIARIGLLAVESLESDQRGRKYSADELRAIRDGYRERARELSVAASAA